MQSTLAALRDHVRVLTLAADPPLAGKRSRGGKTERLKAVVAIENAIARKSTQNALSAASRLEMIRGPQEDKGTIDPPLGWAELSIVVLETLDQACSESLSSKSASKSGVATIKLDYMTCFRSVLKKALAFGPAGVIRSMVPACLFLAHQWLTEPPLRAVLGDHIWQCVRDLLQDDSNRAMLTPPYIRTWVDVCVEQLTSRGPLHHKSNVATKLAGDVLQTLARGVDNYDVLTQSTKSLAPSKMLGGDFGYAIICERCCLMLIISESIPRREARELQAAAFKALVIALSDHGLDVIGSSGLQSIIHASLKPIEMCWNDRRFRDSAISLAKVLLFLAPCHSKLLETCRNKIRSDMKDEGSSAVVRAGNEVTDDFVDAAAVCVSLRECLEFARSSESVRGHIIIWLRVAYAIVSRRVLKKQFSLVADAPDVFDQCTKAAESVAAIFRDRAKIRANDYVEIVLWSTRIIKLTAVYANRIHSTLQRSSSLALDAWHTVYRVLKEQLTNVRYSMRSRLTHVPLDGEPLHPDQSLLEAISLLSRLQIIEEGALELSSHSFDRREEVPYPLSRFLSADTAPSALEVEYFRNLIARSGLPGTGAEHLHTKLINSLLELCGTSVSAPSAPRLVQDAACAMVGLTRGECGLSSDDEYLTQPQRNIGKADSSFTSQIAGAFCEHIGYSASEERIMDEGSQLVMKVKDQGLIWARPNSLELGHVVSADAITFSGRTGRLQRSHGGTAIIRHFSVDSLTTDSLEDQIETKLRSIANNSNLFSSPAVDYKQISPQTALECNSEQGFSNDAACVVGSKIILFITNYLIEGIVHGVIFVSSNSAVPSAIRRMVILLIQLVPMFSATHVDHLLSAVDLAMGVICAIAELSQLLERDLSQRRPSQEDEDQLWETALNALQKSMSYLISSLTDVMLHSLTSKLQRNRELVQHCANGYLVDFGSRQVFSNSKKRKLTRTRDQHRAKRQRPGSSSSSEKSSGIRTEDRNKRSRVETFPGVEEEDGFQSASEASDSDDFEDHLFKTSPRLSKNAAQKDSAADQCSSIRFRDIAKMIQLCAEQLPFVKDRICEAYVKGLDDLDDIEQALSPDGFERSSLMSSLIDPSIMQLRQLLWSILFSIGTSESVRRAAKDLVQVGWHLKELERVAHAYVSFYVNSLPLQSQGRSHIRKTYPMPYTLEVMRTAFLEYGRHIMAFFRTSHSDSAADFEDVRLQTNQSGIPYLINSLVDVSEHFRISHALRMPRRARISYLKFGVAALQLLTEKCTAIIRPQTGETELSTSLQKAIHAIQGALCKFLADAEAVVRTVAASMVPRLLGTYSSPFSRVEMVLQDSVPQSNTCYDSAHYLGCSSGDGNDTEMEDPLVDMQFNLSSPEHLAFSSVHKSFRRLGSRSKACTALLALAEVARAREDFLPFCLIQMFTRILNGAGNSAVAYHLIARLCIAYGHSSPRRFYHAFSRVLLSKWFKTPRALENLYSFPAQLVVDEGHHNDSLLYDWMRDHQDALLSYIIVRDSSSLDGANHFADALGLDLLALLSANVGAVALVIPMQFMEGSFHEKGLKLWQAIDSALDGQASLLLRENKVEVIQRFLRSASCGLECVDEWNARAFDRTKVTGFCRNAKQVQPPLYDPLVISIAINQLFETNVADFMSLQRSALQGSLFAEVREFRSGTVIAESFKGFLEECQRGKVTLMRVLLVVSRFVHGPPNPQPRQNQLDGFFCVGLLWRMLGVNLLAKSSTERVIFYRLVARGFEFIETAHDASWLLQDVQRKVASMHTDYPDVTVGISDLCTDPSKRDFLLCMNTPRERQMYELLSLMSPALVSIISRSEVSKVHALHSIASSALINILQLCDDEGLWTVILSNGPFPKSDAFAQGRKLYARARAAVESKSSNDTHESIVASLSRFQGIQRFENGSQSSMPILACLQELKELLSHSAVRALRRRMKREAWVRTDGRSSFTAPIIEKSIASIINVTHETFLSADYQHARQFSIGHRTVDHGSEVSAEILHEIANVLGVLGIVQPQSHAFISSGMRHKAIPGFSQKRRYQGVISGIEMCFLMLLDALQGHDAIAADYSLSALIDLLTTEDGKKVYSKEHKHTLSAITPFRGAARRLAVSKLPSKELIPCDPNSGEEVPTGSFPTLLDPELWCMQYLAVAGNDLCETWMRRLSYVLAKNCNSDGLRKLSPICYISLKISHQLLPYILMDIVQGADAQSLQKLSSLVRQYIFGNTEAPVEILRTFVHSLDVLAQMGLEQLVQKGITQRVRKNDGRPQICPIYTLEVPYIEAAQVALRSGSYFSAIRFAQMHVDKLVLEEELQLSNRGTKSRGERRYSSCPSRDPAVESAEHTAREDVKSILREAMTQINEPDGVRAFGYEESLSVSSAGLAVLDKDWSKSLSALDIATRTMASDDDNASQLQSDYVHSSDNVGTNEVHLQRELAKFIALIEFGSLSIATDYWYGLHRRFHRSRIRYEDGSAKKDSSFVQGLNDLRYALAWKLGHWESPSLLPMRHTPSVSNDRTYRGFHETVYEVLRGFRTRRYDGIPKALSDARSTQLMQLVGGISGVSASSVFQTSARLHVFTMFEDLLSSCAPETVRYRSDSLSPENETHSLGTKTIAATSSNGDKLAGNNVRSEIDASIPSTTDLLRRMMGEYYGMQQEEVMDSEVSLFTSVAEASVFAEDLPVMLTRCLNEKTSVTRASATVSYQLLNADRTENWARATSSLGTKVSSYFKEASKLDRLAWKLQESRLRWSASDDAPLRKQALSEVKDMIAKDMSGGLSGQSSRLAPNLTAQSSLEWDNSHPSVELAFLRSEACHMAAAWSLDMRSDEPMNLFDMYLAAGLRAVESCKNGRPLAGRAHFAMATFADAQIARIDEYRKTRNYDQMVKVIKEVEEKIEKLKTMKASRKGKARGLSRRGSRSSKSQMTSGAVTESQIGKDLDLLIRNEEKRVYEDRSRLTKLNEIYQKWQILACKHFAASLRDGSLHDLRAAFRMVAIWLDSGAMRDSITMILVNANDKSFDYINSSRAIDVPVSKLLPLAPQLSSRLSFSQDMLPSIFQKTLGNTIHRMAEKFPSHCLWQLLALSNLTRISANQEKYSSLYRGDKGKKEAADDILRRLQAKHGPTVEEMKKVADAYIALSETSDNQKKGSTLDISGTAIARLRSLANVHVPTVLLPLNGNDCCGSIPTIAKFDNTASICAGLSKPLRIVCYGSDGNRYPQMVKGKDDLRGDAVMEQVFAILNSLLEKDSEASKRNLLVRTYRIIPLSPFSGIMQFVQNTRQFRELLVGASSAGSLHERYRPRDLKADTISNKAFELRKPRDLGRRLQYLKLVWPRFQPVFRYFFLEQWPDPGEWLSHQLAYSRSVAVMSIVGFILGLGDRHLSNILVDVVTGEVVHIDFGIAFEQGKLLPTPELMPFRLTRDVVDGFGIAGVEGVFRRCSEVTLRVMRMNKDVLMTVAEVLLHDPMFNWDLTPEEVLREQLAINGNDAGTFESDGMSRSLDESAADEIVRKFDNDANGSKDARRALHRISEKLDGLEGTERLSVEAHVARLVDEAQAFHVIAPVYPGWAPWL